MVSLALARARVQKSKSTKGWFESDPLVFRFQIEVSGINRRSS